MDFQPASSLQADKEKVLANFFFFSGARVMVTNNYQKWIEITRSGQFHPLLVLRP
jgi:hypothetical protein